MPPGWKAACRIGPNPDNALLHNWWHAALFHLDLDNVERVLAIYDTAIRPGDQVQLEMVDAASLRRMHLRGIDVGDRWRSIADAYERTDEPGFYAFNDMHAMMAYGAAAAPLPPVCSRRSSGRRPTRPPTAA